MGWEGSVGKKTRSAWLGEKARKIKTVHGPEEFFFFPVALKTVLVAAKLGPE